MSYYSGAIQFCLGEYFCGYFVCFGIITFFGVNTENSFYFDDNAGHGHYYKVMDNYCDDLVLG